MENRSATSSVADTAAPAEPTVVPAAKSGRVRVHSTYIELSSRRSRVGGLRLSLRTLLLAVLAVGSAMGLYWNYAPWAEHGGVTYSGSGLFPSMGEYSADNRYLALAYSDKSVRIFEAQSGTLLLTLQAQRAAIEQIHFSPDGKRLLTSTADDTVSVFDAANGNLLLEMKDLTLLGGFSPDSLSVLVRTTRTTRNARGSQEYHESPLVSVFDVSTALYRPIPNSERASLASFSASGRKVVIAQRDGTLRMIDLDGRILSDELGESFVGNSPDGLSMLAGMLNGQGASIIDVTSGKIVRTLAGHTGRIYSARYSPNGQSVVTSGSDGKVRVWDASTGELNATLDCGPKILARPGVTFVDNTHVLIPQTNGTATVWIKRRPEYQAGMVMLPELWALILFFAATLWSVAKDQGERRSGRIALAN